MGKSIGRAFQKGSKNATYRSKTTQTEIHEFCSEVICEQIIANVRSSKFYSLLADEETDCSTKEQMLLVLFYVDRNREIQERFVTFIHCDNGISGKGKSGPGSGSHTDLNNPSDFSIENVPQICSGESQTVGSHHVDKDCKGADT